ncbi:hypothetical protein KP509_08G031700 [Ceratopteris richardii]|uniref:Uncharacterized protein n=1 Tax=Ceratopteris richardii TaxID=49495 RepID=A0A8T2UC53_CERRI|nr:hypothetical protein KP509_08G031700 [Ceratopteris richardii]
MTASILVHKKESTNVPSHPFTPFHQSYGLHISHTIFMDSTYHIYDVPEGCLWQSLHPMTVSSLLSNDLSSHITKLFVHSYSSYSTVIHIRGD